MLPWRLRALAVPLDHASTRGTSRRWYRPAIEPLPPEPGRLVVSALLGRARRTRGCSSPGDDRLETRAYAVKRYLCRPGHAGRSARYATSIAQLVVGLAPVMGWGPVPRGRAERARFVRAHRRSVQRWLDDLEAAGLVVHEPERDGDGSWWRTQIVLLVAPEPSARELAVALRRPSIALARVGTASSSAHRSEPRCHSGAQRRALSAHARPTRRRTPGRDARGRATGRRRDADRRGRSLQRSDASLPSASYVGPLAGRSAAFPGT